MNASAIQATFEARQHAAAELRALDTRAAGREFTAEERATDERLNATIAEHDARMASALATLAQSDAADESRAKFDRLLNSGQPTSEYRAGNWLANELRAITGSAGLGAAVTPPDLYDAVLDLLAPTSVLLASGVQTIRTDRDSVAFPHLLTDAASAFVAAGATISNADPTGESLTATPQKVASLLAIHNEVILDSNPAILDTAARSLIRSIGLTFDLGAFEGNGTAPNIRGLKNIAGIQTVSMGANGATPTNLDPFADALGSLESQNANGAKAVVMHPRTWGVLAKV
jgi:HK97 family phage major capsid protein